MRKIGITAPGLADIATRPLPRYVLVTGGAGFLGSHLCERLLQDGHRVICSDNFSTGRRSNVSHLMSNPDFSVIEQDVRDAYDADVSLIFNFASPASPPDYQRDPVGTLLTGVLGALHGLELPGCTVQPSYNRPHPRFMAIRCSTHSRKPIAATSTRSARAAAMTKANAAPKHCFLTTTANTGPTSRLAEYSTLMGRACASMTAGSFRTSSSRP
jgi:hypothetical protein